jgi:hypothetical protein
MPNALTPAQGQALANMHKQLADLVAAEGKGGPDLSKLIATIQADMLAVYKQLLGIPEAK